MTRRRAARPAPVVPTRRLVAHVPWQAEEADGLQYGPLDGDPVDLPAPCVRVLAGYWCPCGGSFVGTRTWEVVHFARVVPVEGGDPPRYVDDRENGYEAPVPWPTVDQREALLAQIEALPIGAVVERHGVGLALRFSDLDDPVSSVAGPSEEFAAW